MLEALGVPPSTARLIGFFAANASARPSVRELQRTLGIGSASAQRDLQRLVKAGALEAMPDGRLIRYRVNEESPIWRAVRLLTGHVYPDTRGKPMLLYEQNADVDM